VKPVWSLSTVPDEIVPVSASYCVVVGDGGGDDGGVTTPSSTVSESRFGPPSAVLEVARMVFAPATSVACTETVAHVSHVPVLVNDRAEATTAPLTVIVIGRSAVVPLAYRQVSVASPAVEAGTLSSR
jgi:hypothetical protein